MQGVAKAMVVIILQYVSNQHTALFKFTQFICQLYLRKSGGKKKEPSQPRLKKKIEELRNIIKQCDTAEKKRWD